jgi:hypothetical protein
MTATELVNPNIGNFIDSLREVGYSFEVAAADIIDNSIAAGASRIDIHIAPHPAPIFSMLDNGRGMTKDELVEAMRLASRGPKDSRSKEDLGRYGLGLKMASFSQCTRLTVVSKARGNTTARQWDLEYISDKNEWLLITPQNYSALPLAAELDAMESGTLVCWENIDRLQADSLPAAIDRLRRHLSMVFHRYLDGTAETQRLKIAVNGNPIAPFDPFNLAHAATQQGTPEKIKFNNDTITVQPFILPHHSKLSRQEYEWYATEEGYIKSQGFYLYRRNRILTHGTWWGLHKASDAHKLVRIKIDIPNNMDFEWGLDVKKSVAHPPDQIKGSLRRIIAAATEAGSRPYTGRGRKIEDKTVTQFWQLLPVNDNFRFAVNLDHPVYRDLVKDLPPAAAGKLVFYLKGLQAYLPLEAIQFHLQKHPHSMQQLGALTEEDVLQIASRLKSAGMTDEFIQELLRTEIFRTRKDLLEHGTQ